MYPVEPETERLILRELSPMLAPRLWPLVRAEHGIFGPPDMAETEHELRAWLARRQADAREDDRRQYRWVLERKDTRALIGSTRCHIEDPFERVGSIGYAVLAAHRRQGFAFEAASRALSFGFDELGLARIASAVEPHNEASMALMAKLGFRRGRFAQRAIRERDGVHLDAYLWALDADEWRARSR